MLTIVKYLVVIDAMNPKMNDIMDFIDENHPTYDKFSTCLQSTNKNHCTLIWHWTTSNNHISNKMYILNKCVLL